jgi:hypothetical protein
MIHACFAPIALYFVYTSWRFYAFSRTNLLQDAIVPIPVFRCFCVSEKLHRKYSQNWTKRSSKFLFSPTQDGVQSRDGGGPGGGHTTWWHGSTPGHATTWCGPPWCPLISPLRLYKASDAKTLNQSAFVHKKFRSTAAIEDEVRGTEVSVLAPCRDRELPTEPSPSTPPPSSYPLLSPMMRRE